MPMHSYIFAPTRETWPASSVNARVPPVRCSAGKPTTRANQSAGRHWLDQNRPVEQMTWAPGLPMQIRDRLISDGGWIERGGCLLQSVSAADDRARQSGRGRAVARPRSQSLRRRCGAHVRWLAHRVQRPERRSITPWCSAARRASARTRCSSRSSMRSGRGISTRCRRSTCSARFNGFLKSVDPARQRGARPRRHRSLPVLRPHEDIHSRAARRAAGR